MKTAITIMLVASLGASAGWSYTVVTKDGRRLQAEKPPEYKGGKAVVVLAGGLKIEMAEGEIDRDASAKANLAPVEAKTFGNDDLAKAKGLSTIEGEVTAEGKDAVLAPSSPLPTSSARSRVRGRDNQGPSEAAGRVYELQTALDAVTKEIRSRCKEWSFENPSNDCDQRLFDDQKRLMAELDEARKERDAEVREARAERGERDGDTMDRGEREQSVADLERRVESLRESLADADARLARSNSTAVDLNRRLQIADALTRAERELEAARGD